jgi:hypothetical protein
MKKINILLVLVFIAVTFSKCHVMKRTYRNGYYIAWDKKASHLKNDNTLKKEDAELNDIVKYTEPVISELLLASNERAITLIEKKKHVEVITQLTDTCGDIIKLKNGDEIVAKVLEVSQTTIKYKKCNNLDGPLMVESIDNVFMIKYVNGSKDVFNKPTKQIVDSPKKENTQTGEKKYNKFAVMSFIFSFFFIVWGISCIFSLIFAIKALRQMKKEPGKYKGKAFAMVGLIVSAVVLGVILLAILSAILFV